MLSETCHRSPRRYGPVSAARHDQLGAGTKLDRRRRPAGVPQLFATAGRTLRAGGDVVLRDTRAQHIVSDDVLVLLGAKARGDLFSPLAGGQLHRALSERVACAP